MGKTLPGTSLGVDSLLSVGRQDPILCLGSLHAADPLSMGHLAGTGEGERAGGVGGGATSVTKQGESMKEASSGQGAEPKAAAGLLLLVYILS